MMAISNRTKIGRVSNRLRRDERRDVLRFESLENRLMLSGSTSHDISTDHLALGDQIAVFSPNVADGLTVAHSAVLPKLNSHLNNLYREFGAHVPGAVGVDFVPSNDLLQIHGETVIIDAVASGAVQTLLEDLSRLGLQQVSQFGSIVSGFIPISALDQLAEMNSLQFANAALRPWIHEGSVTTQGDTSMNGVSARGMFGGIDGSGVTVGILSDSFDTGAGSYATDVASGDLPAGIQVLEDFPGGTDEGRAMAQLIYDVAPGANFAFHSAFNGMADFANGITELATIGGADVIVDDVIYFEEPMFQDGIIAQAVDAVVASGVSYF
jgi:hypothetical protein